MEGINPDPPLVIAFIALLLLAASAIKKIFTPTVFKTEHEFEDEPEEEYDVSTTTIYDNAEANNLLDAKMRTLELAITFHGSGVTVPSADDVAKTARIWWDFIALQPDDDSDE